MKTDNELIASAIFRLRAALFSLDNNSNSTLSILANTTAIMDAMFGLPKLHKLEAGAPNEAHYADRAEWLNACAEYEHKMGLAAGEATCGDEPTPGQIEAHARYTEALAGARK
jgi:hypothetical protein